MTREYPPTPGPWHVVSGAVETLDGTPIASMDRESGNGTAPTERDSNAALIAAAPEMFDALVLTLEMLEGVPGVHADESTERPYRIADIRRAIAKAKGAGQ